MTNAITNPNPVRLDQATEFLQQRFGERVSAIEALPAGAWSSPFGYRLDGEAFVIRFNPVREDFEKDALVGTWATRVDGLPIPPILELGEAFDGYYAVAPRVSGEFIDRLDATTITATLPSLFATLDAIHDLPLPGASRYGGFDANGRGGHDDWASYLLDVGTDPPAPRGHGWRRKLDQSPTGPAVFDRALHHLTGVVDALPAERRLIHADTLHNNVFVIDEQISGVIDWQCGTLGDPLYDIAWVVWCWSYFPQWVAIDPLASARKHLAAVGRLDPDFEQRVHAYLIHIGLDDVRYSAYTENWEQVASASSALDQLISRIA